MQFILKIKIINSIGIDNNIIESLENCSVFSSIIRDLLTKSNVLEKIFESIIPISDKNIK